MNIWTNFLVNLLVEDLMSWTLVWSCWEGLWETFTSKRKFLRFKSELPFEERAQEINDGIALYYDDYCWEVMLCPALVLCKGFSQKLPSVKMHFPAFPCAARGSRELLECISVPVTRLTIGCIHSFIYSEGLGSLSYQNNEHKVEALRQAALPALDLSPAPPPPDSPPPTPPRRLSGRHSGSRLYSWLAALWINKRCFTVASAHHHTRWALSFLQSGQSASRPVGLGMFGSRPEAAVPRFRYRWGGWWLRWDDVASTSVVQGSERERERDGGAGQTDEHLRKIVLFSWLSCCSELLKVEMQKKQTCFEAKYPKGLFTLREIHKTFFLSHVTLHDSKMLMWQNADVFLHSRNKDTVK